jgi:hypothetical protein
MVETNFNWTRVNNDVNGNPRFVVHFLSIMPKKFDDGDIQTMYDRTVKWANKLGGRKFHNRQYGGGIVFQSYSLPETEKYILQLQAKTNMEP